MSKKQKEPTKVSAETANFVDMDEQMRHSIGRMIESSDPDLLAQCSAPPLTPKQVAALNIKR